MTARWGPGTYSGIRALVLGGSGFIGRWVAGALTTAGAELHTVVRNPAEAGGILARHGGGGTVHQADLADLDATRALLARLAPAVVFNLAGYGVNPDEKRAASESRALILNAELPGVLAQTLAGAPFPSRWPGRRLVHAGSIFEYGNIGGHLEESALAAPTDLYGRTKLAGTQRMAQACASAGLQGVSARLCQVYGPGEHPGRLLPMLIEARRDAEPLLLSVGTQRKDFTYVGDVAEGLLRLGATSGPPGEIVNLATGRLATVREFVLTAAHLLRLDRDRLKFEKPLPDNELQHLEVAVHRLRKLTGWVPGIEVTDGLQRTLDFLDRTRDE